MTGAYGVREDYSRKRKGFAAQNIDTIAKVALSMLVHYTSYRAGKKLKHLKTDLDHKYREKLLNF